MALDDFNKWEANDFAPESSFLEKVKAIDGITFVETQTFTLMPMSAVPWSLVALHWFSALGGRAIEAAGTW